MSDEGTGDEAARDADHLRILVVLAFVYAVLGVLTDLAGLLGALDALQQMSGFEFPALLVILRQAVTCAAGVALPFLLMNRTSRTLCAVAAFLVAWDAPAGTVLAVLVLIVLARRSVAHEFEAAAAARGADGPDREALRREMIARAAKRKVRQRREEAEPGDTGDAAAPSLGIDIGEDDLPRSAR